MEWNFTTRKWLSWSGAAAEGAAMEAGVAQVRAKMSYVVPTRGLAGEAVPCFL